MSIPFFSRCKRSGLVFLILISNAFSAADTDQTEVSPDSSFRFKTEHSIAFAGILLPHRSLRNSESLHDWPFFGFVAPMAWNSKIMLDKEVHKMLTLKGVAGGSLALFGAGLKVDVSLDVAHLLELGVEGGLMSGINYGSMTTSMGVYAPEKQKYSADMFGTEFSYEVRYHAALSMPLMAFLPRSEWTKIMLRPTANLIYAAYTGAEDGEVWKAGTGDMVNGLRYQVGGTMMYFLPFKHFPMAMFSANVSGFKHESDFDAVYEPYDPGFKTVTLVPMLSIKLDERWGGMLMATFARERRYRNYHFETGTELSQERVGSEWGLKAILLMLSRKF